MSLNTTWFVVLAFTLAVYAVLDGFDLGIGAIAAGGTSFASIPLVRRILGNRR